MNYEYTTSLRLTTPRQTLGCVQKKLPDIYVHAINSNFQSQLSPYNFSCKPGKSQTFI